MAFGLLVFPYAVSAVRRHHRRSSMPHPWKGPSSFAPLPPPLLLLLPLLLADEDEEEDEDEDGTCPLLWRLMRSSRAAKSIAGVSLTPRTEASDWAHSTLTTDPPRPLPLPRLLLLLLTCLKGWVGITWPPRNKLRKACCKWAGK